MRKLEGKNLPSFVQKLMDDNFNCCFNCLHFKLVNSPILTNSYSYRKLKGKCTNIEAIYRNGNLVHSVLLGMFSSRKNIPEVRKNCPYFNGELE